jgi:hypothetical protein
MSAAVSQTRSPAPFAPRCTGAALAAVALAAATLFACTASEEPEPSDAGGDEEGGADVVFDLPADLPPDWGPDLATDIVVDPARCVDRDAWAVLLYEGIHRDGPLRLERYFVAAPWGGEPVADEDAARALAAVGFDESSYSDYLDYLDQYLVERAGAFWFVLQQPSDFGAAAFVDARNGTLPFVGTIVWSGSGGLLRPRPWLGYPDELPFAGAPAVAPAETTRVDNSHWDEAYDPTDRLGLALQRALHSELAYAFAACGDYEAVLWAYTPGVGSTDAESARALVLLSGRTTSDWLPGDGSLGTNCRDHYDCASGLCAAVSNGDGVCAEPCEDGTCEAGFTCVGEDEGGGGDGDGELPGACQPDDFCVDHDGDGAGAGLGCAADCDDADPSASPDHAERDAGCSDGVDNDCDGLFDCADPSCAEAIPCLFELCSGGIDDDRDGLTDCADLDCAFDVACEPRACATDGDRDLLGRVDPVATANRDILACDQDPDWADPADCVLNTFVVNGASERCGRCFANLASCGLERCAESCRSLDDSCLTCERQACWSDLENCLGEPW